MCRSYVKNVVNANLMNIVLQNLDKNKQTEYNTILVHTFKTKYQIQKAIPKSQLKKLSEHEYNHCEAC